MKKIRNFVKSHGFGMAVAGIALGMLFLFAGIVLGMQFKAEASVKQADAVEDEIMGLYKNEARSEEAARAVCERFKLDYDTVAARDVYSDREKVDYESAAVLKLEYGDRPLLIPEGKSAEELGLGSLAEILEGYLDDIYAFDGGKKIVLQACEEKGIDPVTGKIGDFTIEELMKIEKRAFEESDHGK